MGTAGNILHVASGGYPESDSPCGSPSRPIDWKPDTICPPSPFKPSSTLLAVRGRLYPGSDQQPDYAAVLASCDRSWVAFFRELPELQADNAAAVEQARNRLHTTFLKGYTGMAPDLQTPPLGEETMSMLFANILQLIHAHTAAAADDARSRVVQLSSQWLPLKYRVALKSKLTPFWKNCTGTDELSRVFAKIVHTFVELPVPTDFQADDRCVALTTPLDFGRASQAPTGSESSPAAPEETITEATLPGVVNPSLSEIIRVELELPRGPQMCGSDGVALRALHGDLIHIGDVVISYNSQAMGIALYCLTHLSRNLVRVHYHSGTSSDDPTGLTVLRNNVSTSGSGADELCETDLPLRDHRGNLLLSGRDRPLLPHCWVERYEPVKNYFLTGGAPNQGYIVGLINDSSGATTIRVKFEPDPSTRRSGYEHSFPVYAWTCNHTQDGTPLQGDRPPEEEMPAQPEADVAQSSESPFADDGSLHPTTSHGRPDGNPRKRSLREATSQDIRDSARHGRTDRERPPPEFHSRDIHVSFDSDSRVVRVGRGDTLHSVASRALYIMQRELPNLDQLVVTIGSGIAIW